MSHIGPVATCPRCASQSLQAIVVPKRQVGSAALTQAMLGTAAGVAAGTSTVVKNVCLSCGLQWFPGTRDEDHIRALSGQLGAEREAAIEAQDAEELRKEMQRQEDAAKGRVLFFWISVAALLISWLIIEIK